jgi:hypothetical protein
LPLAEARPWYAADVRRRIVTNVVHIARRIGPERVGRAAALLVLLAAGCTPSNTPAGYGAGVGGAAGTDGEGGMATGGADTSGVAGNDSGNAGLADLGGASGALGGTTAVGGGGGGVAGGRGGGGGMAGVGGAAGSTGVAGGAGSGVAGAAGSGAAGVAGRAAGGAAGSLVAGAGGAAGAAGSAGAGAGGVTGAAGGAGAGAAGAAAGGATGGAGAGGVAGEAGGAAGTAGAASAAGAGGTAGAAGVAGGAAGHGGSVGVAGATGGTGSVLAAGQGGGAGAPGAAGATACTLDSAHSGSGSFTYYYLGQRPASEPPGYRTACGYSATASGMVDTVENVATTGLASNSYFAAIPGQSNFDSRSNCGACVRITGPNGKTIIATIVDECPYGSDGDNPPCADNPTGHLDLSYEAFQQLGYSRGDPTGTSWRIVPCPVTGNVKVRFKQGNNNEIFIENGVTSFSTVTINGLPATRQKYGAWHIDGAIMLPAAVHTVDRYGRALDFTLGSDSTTNQDTGQKSPTCQ